MHLAVRVRRRSSPDTPLPPPTTAGDQLPTLDTHPLTVRGRSAAGRSRGGAAALAGGVAHALLPIRALTHCPHACIPLPTCAWQVIYSDSELNLVSSGAAAKLVKTDKAVGNAVLHVVS